MLHITIPETESWDENNQQFIHTKKQKLQLEHSLVSISKWESKWCKPFLSTTKKTREETVDYIKNMTITQNVKDDTYYGLTQDNIDEINKYIEAPMSATYINDDGGGRSREPVTSELIYYWMITLNIPMECQRWHLNRLLTLVKVCNLKNSPPKKRSRREILSRNNALNEERKKKLQTKG